jgi:hypothetical protein
VTRVLADGIAAGKAKVTPAELASASAPGTETAAEPEPSVVTESPGDTQTTPETEAEEEPAREPAAVVAEGGDSE